MDIAVVGWLFLVFCVAGGGQCDLLLILVLLSLFFGARKSMDTRGDLLSCLMFGGRWRWSGRSLDTGGELLFILALVSWFVVPVNRWMLGVIYCLF